MFYFVQNQCRIQTESRNYLGKITHFLSFQKRTQFYQLDPLPP